MKIITINISEFHLSFFEKITVLGLYPSRSEALRHCIDVGMKSILEEYNAAAQLVENDKALDLRDFLLAHGFKLKGQNYKTRRQQKEADFPTKGRDKYTESVESTIEEKIKVPVIINGKEIKVLREAL